MITHGVNIKSPDYLYAITERYFSIFFYRRSWWKGGGLPSLAKKLTILAKFGDRCRIKVGLR